MARAGFGGVEVAYVYPLAAATHRVLSEPFLADLRFAAERARELGLRFDLTLGSGWSFGGPHITADLAARRLRWERREIRPGALDVPVTSPWPGDELVAAYLGAGSLQESRPCYEPLPVVDGMIKIPDGQGPGSCCSRALSRPGRTSSGPRPGRRARCSTTTAPRPSRRTCAGSVTGCSTRSRPSWSARSSATASRSTARTGPPAAAGVRPAPRVPAASRAASARVPGPDAAPGPRGLPPHARRALRGELRRGVPAVGRRPRRAVPDPELRNAAGNPQQLPVR